MSTALLRVCCFKSHRFSLWKNLKASIWSWRYFVALVDQHNAKQPQHKYIHVLEFCIVASAVASVDLSAPPSCHRQTPFVIILTEVYFSNTWRDTLYHTNSPAMNISRTEAEGEVRRAEGNQEYTVWFSWTCSQGVLVIHSQYSQHSDSRVIVIPFFIHPFQHSKEWLSDVPYCKLAVLLHLNHVFHLHLFIYLAPFVFCCTFYLLLGSIFWGFIHLPVLLFILLIVKK